MIFCMMGWYRKFVKKICYSLPTLELGNIPKLQHINIYGTKNHRVDIVAHVIDQKSCGLICYRDHPLIFERNIKTVGIVVALLGPKQTAYEERET